MRVRIASVVVAAAMTAFIAAPAMASPVSVDGDVTVNQSVTLNCGFSAPGDHVAGSVTMNTHNVSLISGDSSCSRVTLKNNWVGTYSGSGVVPLSIANVAASSLLGTCGAATISGTFDTTTGEIDIPYQTIPGVILLVPTTCGLGGYLILS